MNGKIILNLAVSLDGYIADLDGGYDWIVGDGNSTLNTENKWSHDKFLENIDVVVIRLVKIVRSFLRHILWLML